MLRSLPEVIYSGHFEVLTNTGKFSEHVGSLISTVSQFWRDPRVPLFARVLFVLAPLYWLCPFDLSSDLLPGGYIDDIFIVPTLFLSGLSIVPRPVLADAKKAIAKALCGIVCLSFSVPAFAHGSNSDPMPLGTTQHICLTHSKSLQVQVQARPFSGLQHDNGLTVHQHLTPSLNNVAPFQLRKVLPNLKREYRPSYCLVFPNRTLAIRGGQHQVYSSDDGSESQVSKVYFDTIVPLPDSAGGIFVAFAAGNLHIRKVEC